MKWPADAPLGRVLKALAALGFEIVREGNHVALQRTKPNGSTTPMTIPNHRALKGSTLRAICTQAGISRDEFLAAYGRS